MDLPLTDEQTAALLAELNRIIDNDRYPLSSRIRTLKDPRTSTALVGVVKLGLVQCGGDNPLLRI
jgi:hypothetical protein